jgi:hypothetical protein
MRCTTQNALNAGLFAMLGAVALGAGIFFCQRFNSMGASPNPAIEVQREFELGEHELLSTVEPLVVVRNNGRQPLTIRKISTSCGCLGVFAQREGGHREKLESLEIASGGEARLILRLAVTGQPGRPELRRVGFQTNDPRNPTVELFLSVTPIARFVAVPANVVFGTLPVGVRMQRDVDVMAADQGQPAITYVTSSNTHIRAEYFPAGALSERQDTSTKAFELRGRLTIRLDAPAGPGECEGVISVHCVGRHEPVITVPVSARVARLVELCPGELTLPRASSAGPVYAATCVCRSSVGKRFGLVVRESPPDVAVQITEALDNPSLKIIQVDAAKLRDIVPAGGLTTELALDAEIDGQCVPLTLKLTVQGTYALADGEGKP